MKRGTHWKPQPKRTQDKAEPLRPMRVPSQQIEILRGSQAKLEAELRHLFAARREFPASDYSTAIKQRSQNLRDVKAEIARQQAKV